MNGYISASSVRQDSEITAKKNIIVDAQEMLQPSTNDNTLSNDVLPLSTPATTTLEGLPTEIKLIVLHSLSDITALRAVVHASPLYHSLYLSQREEILTAVLCADINHKLFFVACSASINFGSTSYVDHSSRLDRVKDVLEVLNTIADPNFRLTGCLANWEVGWEKKLISRGLFQTARLHFIVLAVLAEYCYSTLTMHPMMSAATEVYPALSQNEKHRIQRALYLYDLSCKLSPSNFHGQSGSPTNKLLFTQAQVSDLFLSKLEIWEVEEIACINYYIFQFYKILFRDCVPDLTYLEPRLLAVRQRSHADTSIFAPWGPPFEEKYQYWTSLGLEFFYRISRAEHKSQVALLAENYWEKSYISLSTAISLYRAQHHVAKHVNLYTVCDMERSWSEERWPAPNANSLLSSERYDLCIFDVPDTTRAWGYVFWDRDRLRRWGVPPRDIRTIGVKLNPRGEGQKKRKATPKNKNVKSITFGANWWSLKRLVAKSKNDPGSPE